MDAAEYGHRVFSAVSIVRSLLNNVKETCKNIFAIYLSCRLLTQPLFIKANITLLNDIQLQFSKMQMFGFSLQYDNIDNFSTGMVPA